MNHNELKQTGQTKPLCTALNHDEGDEHNKWVVVEKDGGQSDVNTVLAHQSIEEQKNIKKKNQDIKNKHRAHQEQKNIKIFRDIKDAEQFKRYN